MELWRRLWGSTTCSLGHPISTLNDEMVQRSFKYIFTLVDALQEYLKSYHMKGKINRAEQGHLATLDLRLNKKNEK